MSNASIETSRNEERLLDNTDRIVNESPQLDSIKQLIDEKGLDPIWVHLIKRFGSIMYMAGGRASQQASRTVDITARDNLVRNSRRS